MSLFSEGSSQRRAVDALIGVGRGYENSKRVMMERAQRIPENKAIFDILEKRRVGVIQRTVRLVERLKREQAHSDSVICL